MIQSEADVTVALFGTGDIILNAGWYASDLEKYFGLKLQNQVVPLEIGKPIENYDRSNTIEYPQILLLFNKLESVDAVIMMLENLKLMYEAEVDDMDKIDIEAVLADNEKNEQ